MKIVAWCTNFLSQHRFKCLFFGLMILATSTRLYQLGQVPHGFTWDEAAIGYNGYSVLTTRRDEWLVRLPISFRSFGDFKAPLGIYLNGTSTFLLGLNAFAVRLPFALASIAGIAGMVLLSQQLFQLIGYPEFKKAKWLALFSGLLMTTSPWHFHFSRVALETGMMTSFLLWGMYFFLRLLNLSVTEKLPWFIKSRRLFLFGLILTTAVCFTAALYTYHSAKIVLPFLGIIVLIFFFKQIWRKKMAVLLTAVTSTLLLWPLIKDMLWSAGGARFTQATIFGLSLSAGEKFNLIVSHFWRHFHLDFLLFGATTTLRHGDGNWGVLFVTTLGLIVCGLIFGIVALRRLKASEYRGQIKLFLFAVLWIMVGTLPAAIGQDVPHPNRDFLALPGFILLATFGFMKMIEFLGKTQLNQQLSATKNEKNLLVKSFIGTWILIEAVFFIQYVHMYFTSFAQRSTADFQDGALAAAQFAIEHEPASEKILFTSSYGQPYIYLLFVKKENPILYQGGSLVKYEFANQITMDDLNRSRTTIIATPAQIDPARADKVIYGADGSIRFVLVAAKELP